MEVVTGT